MTEIRNCAAGLLLRFFFFFFFFFKEIQFESRDVEWKRLFFFFFGVDSFYWEKSFFLANIIYKFKKKKKVELKIELKSNWLRYLSIKLTWFLDSNVINFVGVKYLSSVKLPYMCTHNNKGYHEFRVTIGAYFKGIRMIRVDDDSVMSW